MKTLERRLGLWSVVIISISAMLRGVFVLPGLAVGMTGGSAWLAFLLVAICILPAALSKAELASALPQSGGAYVFINRAFGPL
ncbi:MAG: amino acid permease, partial [Myxococcota bacterium]|nr:amino acid permease [Myxococcota bacterium]